MCLVLIPLLLKITIVKQSILFLLSFTDNIEYKVAYIELVGAIVGSFLAIYGSLWTQSKIDEKKDKDRQKNSACIIYYDLYFAFKALIEIFDETKRKYNLEEINGEDNVNKFCEIALGRELHLNKEWITAVSRLNDAFSPIEIKQIFKYYDKLIAIDRAMQSRDTNRIKEVYIKDICWLVSGNEKKINNDCQGILGKLYSLINS